MILFPMTPISMKPLRRWLPFARKPAEKKLAIAARALKSPDALASARPRERTPTHHPFT
jgi:hypothetical protein